MSVFKRFKAFMAPVVWTFPDPDTKHEYQASSREELIKKIIAYRTQNELPEIEMLGAVVDNYLCGLLENIGKCEKVKLERSWWQTMKGGVALLKNVLVKNPVAREVAEKRGEICATCPHNVFPDKGRFVKWSDKLAEDSVPGKRVTMHNQLGNCEICSCPLKVKVWMQGPFFEEDKSKRDEMRKVGCWQILGDK